MEDRNELLGCRRFLFGCLIAFFILMTLTGFPNIPKYISLHFAKETVEGVLIEHYCPDDFMYVYDFKLGSANYQGKYYGIISTIEEQINEDEGCEGELIDQVPIQIRFVKFYPNWNQPADVPQTSTFRWLIGVFIFIMIIVLVGTAIARSFN